MKHLRKFETTAEYNAYTADTANLVFPNTSVCLDAPATVHYNPIPGPYGKHKYVEIGGLKWATMNMSANSATDYGSYFQWGDTQEYTSDQCGSGSGQKAFDWPDYKYWTADTGSGSSGFTKYNNTDGKTVLDASDDAAVANWGGNWRMPARADLDILFGAVNSEWTSNYNDSGVAGLVCTDKTDSSKVLFFPAVGRCVQGNFRYPGVLGDYWLSDISYTRIDHAYYLNIKSGFSPTWNSFTERYGGRGIRPVAD